MKEPSCYSVLRTQMAVAEGEEPEPEWSKELLVAHIEACANCQHELEQLQALDQMLAAQTLAEPRIDLWPAIENRIAKRSSSAIGWKPFALIGLLLVIYKLVELLPAEDPGMAFKLVPLVIVTLLFVFIRENPFRINTELVLER